MDIQFKGGNCLFISVKKNKIVIDDNLKALGLKQVTGADISLHSNTEIVPVSDDETFAIDGPGEYEVKEISIKGIAARGHMDKKEEHNATIYRIVAQGIRFVSLGHIYPELSDEDLEAIGVVDVLVLPVGGNGFTMDAEGASKMVKAIEPKIVIPTHYQDKKVKYEVDQQPLDEFLEDLGAQPETTDKLSVKSKDLPEKLTVYKLDIT